MQRSWHSANVTLAMARKVRVRIGEGWIRVDGSALPELPLAKPEALAGYGILRSDALSIRTCLLYALAYLQLKLTELDRQFPTVGQAPGAFKGADSSKRLVHWAERGKLPQKAQTLVDGRVCSVIDGINVHVPHSTRLLNHFIYRAGDPGQFFSPQSIRTTLLTCPRRVIRRLPVHAHRALDGRVVPSWRSFVPEDAMYVLRPYCLDSLGAALLIVHELIGQERHREAQQAAEIAAAATTVLFRRALFLSEALRSIALGIDEIAQRPAQFFSLACFRSIVLTSHRRRVCTKRALARKRLKKVLA